MQTTLSRPTTETPEEALARIQSRQFGANDMAAIVEFSERGIPAEDVDPRRNVFTFHAWKAKGRSVAKGAISVRVTTWIPTRNGQRQEPTPEGADAPKQRGGMRPKLAFLFHESQTIPKGAPHGTRPEAWNNPLLIRPGTYDGEMQEPTPDVTLSTGKTVTHTREPNGSQTAYPAMTSAEGAEYEQQRHQGTLFELPDPIPEPTPKPAPVARFQGFGSRKPTPPAIDKKPGCLCPLPGCVINANCPIHGSTT